MKVEKILKRALTISLLLFSTSWALNINAYTNTLGGRYINSGIVLSGNEINLNTGITYDAKDNKAGVNTQVGFSKGITLGGFEAKAIVNGGVMMVGNTKWTASMGLSLTQRGILSFSLGLTTVEGNRLYPYIGLTIGK